MAVTGPSWVLGSQRVVLGITFTLEQTGVVPRSVKPPHRWRAYPLAHDVYVLPTGPHDLRLRVDGVHFQQSASLDAEALLSRCMHKAIKWRLYEIGKWRRALAEYDAALAQHRVADVIATARQVFPNFRGKTDGNT